MKNRFLIILLFLGCSTFAFSQAIDKPLIKVEYDSVDVITDKMLDQRLDQQKSMAKLYNQNSDTINRKEVAYSLVRELLLLQYAQSLDIQVEDRYVSSQIAQQKKMIEQQIGRPITEPEFETVLGRFGINLEQLVENFKRVEIIQKLVNQEKSAFITDFPKPNGADIEKAFNKRVMAGRLIKPAYVNISHLYLEKKPEMKFDEMRLAHDKITKLKNQIEFEGKDFKKMVKLHSDDADTKDTGGILGWTSMQDKKFLALFGEDAALDIVSLGVDELTEVLESPVGFHIVLINDRMEGGVPKIDDKVHPQSDGTYREMFKEMLMQQKAEEAFLVAMDQLYTELEQDAVITYYEKELQ